MSLVGTIVNGHVKLDTPSDLPEGTRVRLFPDADDWNELTPPRSQETREEFLISLRPLSIQSRSMPGRS